MAAGLRGWVPGLAPMVARAVLVRGLAAAQVRQVAGLAVRAVARAAERTRAIRGENP
ncbi:hypothetical protein EMIT0P265_20114 [Pseudomonas zeae]